MSADVFKKKTILKEKHLDVELMMEYKNKGINSIEYYYPDFHERKNCLAYATAFYQYKYLFITYFDYYQSFRIILDNFLMIFR